MQIIAVVNEKGGTGKTTTSVSLAAALGSLGQRILLVDLDGQASTSRWFGVEEDDRLADALLAGEGLEPIENIAPGVSLAPATGKVDSVARDLRPSQSGQLRKVLRQIQDRYDLVIMDCPPSLNNRLIGNALLAATHVLVPVETSIMALDGLQILLTTLEDIGEGFEHQIVLAGVVACRYDSRTRLSRLVLDELRRALPNKVFNTVIRENVRMRECPASGQSILEFAPDSHAAEDYLALAKEMLANPDAWQKPAHWQTTDAADIEDETQRCSVDSLRSRAAANVRAGIAKTSQPKPLAPIEAPAEAMVTPPVEAEQAEAILPPTVEAEQAEAILPPTVEAEQAEAAKPVQTGDAHAAINRWTGGPVPNRVIETHRPPVEIPAEAIVTPPAEAEQAEPGQACAAYAAVNRWIEEPVPNRAIETHQPPVEAEQAESGESAATHAAINRWTGGPVPNRAVEIHQPPVGFHDAAMAPECSPDPLPDQAGLDSYINRLAQAKARLSAPDVQVEADELPAEPELPTEPEKPAEMEPTAAATQDFEPAPVEPAQPAIGAAWNAPIPAPQEPAEPELTDEPDEPEAGDKSFPALRALLRQMGRSEELAEAGSAGGKGANDGR